MESVHWSPEMSLGVPEMDDAHKALLNELARLAAAPDEHFINDFPGLIAALEHDFREEEILMEEIDFPALRSHREQHARVLSGMHHAAPHVMQGNVALGREAIRLFPQWFLFHLTTMDLALAVALDLVNGPKDSAPRLASGSEAAHMIVNIMH